MKIAMALVTFCSTLALAKVNYRPDAMNKVISQVKELKQSGNQPILIFDLDDTLINTRERNMRILEDFALQDEILKNFPEESTKILNIKLTDIKYLITDTLKAVGVDNADLLKLINDFWLKRFFSNAYCAKDKQTPGAAKYLHQLVNAGAKIIYLTGRDIPRMQTGTLLNLRRNFFPASAEYSLLMMKPDAKMDDLLFKKQALEVIAKTGTVVGVFENEPANLNALSDAFPNATAIFVDSIHSPKPDVPKESAKWIKDFKLN